jgi:type VI secretion system protein VasD
MVHVFGVYRKCYQCYISSPSLQQDVVQLKNICKKEFQMSTVLSCINKNTSLVFLFSISLFFSGCATPALNIQLQASDELNQDRQGASYAVLVRFYQLSDPSLFEKADVTALFRQDDDLLGLTLAGKSELMVSPGIATELNIPKIPESKYLGVVAFYRSANGAQQIAVKKVNAGKLQFSTKLQLELSGNQLSLAYR